MPILYFIRIFIVITFAISSNIAVSQSSSIRLEPLGQASIPHNYNFKETPIGGLSGLTYDSQAEMFYVICDDRNELAGARFYSFNVKLSEQGKFDAQSIRFEDVHYLRAQQGKIYPQGKVDPEGIAFATNNVLYVSSEGVPEQNVAPFINAYNKNGKFLKLMSIPEAYWESHNSAGRKQGVRNNLGFEGLTASPDGTMLYAATENALLQDGPAADADNESPSRLIVYDLQSKNVLHEYIYMVNRVQNDTLLLDFFSVNGLTALIAIDNQDHLLSLERNYVAGKGNRIALYDVHTQGATDIKGVTNLQQLAQPPRPVKKELIANLNDFDIAIDNFEGMVLGPQLEGGGRLLLMVSDNNFSENQKTLFTAFRIKGI